MKTKIITGIIALTISGMTFGTVAQAATESETTIQRSTRVDVVPGPTVKEQETTSTSTKKGILGREKTETSTSSTKSVNAYPEAVTKERTETSSSMTTRDRVPDTTVKSRTTVETQKSY